MQEAVDGDGAQGEADARLGRLFGPWFAEAATRRQAGFEVKLSSGLKSLSDGQYALAKRLDRQFKTSC
jgi:hypothetical protein